MNTPLRILAATALLSILLALAACGGTAPVLQHSSSAWSAIYGSSAEGVQVTPTATGYDIAISHLPAAGKFLRFKLQPGQALGAQTWQGADEVLHLAAEIPGGIELGAAPLAAYAGGAIRTSIEVVDSAHRTSLPPVGSANVVTDLSASAAGGGQVALAWTEVNAGDFNFDGIVNVADLASLGALYGRTYDRQAAGAELLTEYWVDASGDGSVGLPDLTAIALNYYSYVHGYDVKHNGTLLGQALRSAATPRAGLPPRYNATFPGAAADAWVVAVVDGLGVEGADSAGGTGPLDLRATFNITGLSLMDLYGIDAGAFGPGRFSTRVIEPIDEVDRTPIGRTKIVAGGTAANFSSLPRNRRLLVDILYAPTVNLATGAPKAPANVRGTSAAGADDIVVTSVPFFLPPGEDTVDVNANITLTPNPAGGYFVELSTVIQTPGDDPSTVGTIEDGYTRSAVTRLDYKDGTVSRDTDANGSFDDEAELGDDNRDCVSNSGLDQVLDDDSHQQDEREELELQGDIASYNEATGMVTLINVSSEAGGTWPATMTLYFAETTRFEERIRTDSGDIEQNLDPTTLAIGDKVETTLYALTQGVGGPADSYWLHELKRVIDQRTH